MALMTSPPASTIRETEIVEDEVDKDAIDEEAIDDEAIDEEVVEGVPAAEWKPLNQAVTA